MPSERITEEQAVAVAEWLGFKWCNVITSRGHKYRAYLVPGGSYGHEEDLWSPKKILLWLYSADGQEALMDRLDQPEFNWKYECLNGPSVKRIYIWNKTQYGEGQARTRQHAFLRAIWELIKGGKCDGSI